MNIVKTDPWAEFVQEQRNLIKLAEEELDQLLEEIKQHKRLVRNLVVQLKRQRRCNPDPYVVSVMQFNLRLEIITRTSLHSKKSILIQRIEGLKVILSGEISRITIRKKDFVIDENHKNNPLGRSCPGTKGSTKKTYRGSKPS